MLGGDNGYDVLDFIKALREKRVTPHIAINGHVQASGEDQNDQKTTPAEAFFSRLLVMIY